MIRPTRRIRSTLYSLTRSTALLAGLSSLPLLFAACSGPPVAPSAESTTPAMDMQVAHREPQLGVPTFVWITAQPSPGSTATLVAWQTLHELAATYGLGGDALSTARLARLHELGEGAVIAQFEQEVAGLEVFRLTLNIAMNRELQPVGATGYLLPQTQPKEPSFTLSADDAVARAVAAMTGVAMQPSGDLAQAAAGYSLHTLGAFAVGGTRYRTASPPRSKKVWYPAASGLIAAYYVELDLSLNDQPDSTMHAYVVAASDGRILLDNDLTANDSYSYRVWADNTGGFTPWDGPHGNGFTPHPTGKRDGTELKFTSSQLVTLANVPFKTNDPWLPAAATDATGNNAVAYADIAAPDGFSTGDVMLKPSAPGEFNYSLDVSKDNPAANATTMQAVTTNFFYIVNYLHDVYYDAGWDEVSRNPQKNNFGRGGVANDPTKAEAQDNSGRNNANASTPADGASPRIQMYLFDPREDAFHVTAPADLNRHYDIGAAAFGPKLFDVSADVVLVDDGTMPLATDGCETPFVNAAAVKDKIAILDRGNCFFELKAYNAQVNGAKGVIIVNNVPGVPGAMAAATTPPPMPVTIPAVMVSQEDGLAIYAKMMAGTTVTASFKASIVNNDSSLDAMIVSHEWGHVLSNRLVGNGSGLVNNQGRSMGEGWSDFVALLMTTRPEDATAAANPNWTGAFAAAAYSTGPGGNSAYEGIRRYPYSSDMTKNPLSFRHIANGTALPAMPVPAFGQDGASNAEVHNSGEVWTSALWECYVALLRDTARYTVPQAAQRMREYLVASLKLTPLSPTMIEARDAVMMSALARDAKDFELFARAFAKRGMGVGAVAPPRASTTHAGVVESNAVGGVIVVDSITVDDSRHSCDRDGILDNVEMGYLTIKLRNTGTLPYKATATVATDSGYISFPYGNRMGFPSVPPFQTVTSHVAISMRGAPTNVNFAIQAVVDATNLAQPGPVVATKSFEGNYDLVAASSARDSMDAQSMLWTTGNDPTLDTNEPWQQVIDASGGRWSIPDHDGPSDQWLISPALKVSATGDFGFTLKHRYSFEFDTSANYDGGVVEISTDDGKTWTDIGASAFTAGGYGGALWAENAPLAGRQAFVAKSTGYPSYLTTTVNLKTAFAGKTVRLRFRLGTDPAVAAPGWDLDDIEFTGTDNLPFPSHLGNSRVCF